MSRLSYWKVLTRRKPMPSAYDSGNSRLGRVLGSFDLTALGVGATLGVGVYVLAGHVARDQAGPSVILSFLIAAAASFLAGLCYSEFGSRVPKSGSAYIYSYCTVGEFIAFVIGWNLLLQYSIGSASVVKGISLYIDSIADNSLKHFFEETFPIRVPGFGNYFDLFCFFVPLLLGVALAFGLKKSALINNVFTMANVGVVLYVIIAGSFKADLKNWTIDPTTVPPEYHVGAGGFFPFGFEGTLKGAATCFFGFVGFDCIATTGEEVRNPHKVIPRAILLSLFIIFLAYFGVSTVLTLMWPYYLQDINAPIPFVFQEIGWVASRWIVTIGGIIGLIASLFGAMFPLPRIIYAMAQDGLIFKFLGNVDERFKTPVVGTLTAACMTGFFSALFDLQSLVSMLSIGTLMAYTVVAISIIMLRFSDSQMEPVIGQTAKESSNLLRPGYNVTPKEFLKQLVNWSRPKYPNTISMSVVSVLVVCYCLCALALSLAILYSKEQLYNGESGAILLIVILLGLSVLFSVLIAIQPREYVESEFKVPIVPFLPALSIFINIYLMLMLDPFTWIRFGIWMILGLTIYVACACYLYNPIIPDKEKLENETNKPNNDQNSNPSLSSEIKENGINHRDESLNVSAERELESIEVIPEQARKVEDKPRQESSEERENNFEHAIGMLDTVLEAEEEMNENEENLKREEQLLTTQSVSEVQEKLNTSSLLRQSSDQSIVSNTIKNHSITAVVHHEHGHYDEGEENIELNTHRSNEDKTVESAETSLGISVNGDNLRSQSRDDKNDPEFEHLERSSGYHTSENGCEFYDSLNTISSFSGTDEGDSLPQVKRSFELLKSGDDLYNPRAIEIKAEIQAEIDEILAEAVAKVQRKLNEKSDDFKFGTINNKKFLEHLSSLIAQPKQPAFILGPQPLSAIITPENKKRGLKQSKSVPDLTNYSDFSKEATVFNAVPVKKNSKGEIIIPPAPKFDPELFNTLSRRKAHQLSLAPKQEETAHQSLLASKQEEVVLRTENKEVKNEAPETEVTLRKSIKERLEKILSIPPPKRMSLKKPDTEPVPPEKTPKSLPIDEKSDGNLSDDSLEIPPINKTDKPFDTVKIQKQKFANVLKSIIGDEDNEADTVSTLLKSKLKPVTVGSSTVY